MFECPKAKIGLKKLWRQLRFFTGTLYWKRNSQTRVKHLGIWLTRAEEDMEKANFDYLKDRMEKATSRIVRRNQCSAYTRALLIEAILEAWLVKIHE